MLIPEMILTFSCSLTRNPIPEMQINMIFFFDQVGELEADSDHWCCGRCSSCPHNRLGRPPCAFIIRDATKHLNSNGVCVSLYCMCPVDTVHESPNNIFVLNKLNLAFALCEQMNNNKKTEDSTDDLFGCIG